MEAPLTHQISQAGILVIHWLYYLAQIPDMDLQLDLVAILT